MEINVQKLTKELQAAGIEIGGCSESGVVWGPDGTSEIQDREDVRAMMTAHNPEEEAKQKTTEEKLTELVDELEKTGVLQKKIAQK